MRLTYLALIGCVSLAACASAPTAPPAGNTATSVPVATPSPVATSGPAQVADKTVLDEKALYAAEALYNLPAKAYVVADRNNKLTPAVKAVLKPKLVTMYDVLGVVRATYFAGNANGFFEAVDRLGKLKVEVEKLLPKAS